MTVMVLHPAQLEVTKKKQEEEMLKLKQKMATPLTIHVTEGATDDQEEGQMTGTTELSMEGIKGVDSELDRVHIAEKNKAMAAKLKVRLTATPNWDTAQACCI